MTSRNDKHADTVIKRVSRKGGEEEHNGSWKVAFADFCLALMCLFLVLWVLAARNQEELQAVLKESPSSLVEDGAGRIPDAINNPRGSLIPREPVPSRSEVEAPQAQGRNLNAVQEPAAGLRLANTRVESAADMQALARLLDRMAEESGLSGNLQTVITPYGLRIMFHDTERQGMFERSSAVPNGRFRLLLRRMGGLFSSIENQMLIVGHTDSLPFSNADHFANSNWTLSSNRAMAARAQLLAGGMGSDSVLQVVGMAEQAPLDPINPAADVNRRIELIVLTSLQARTIAAMFGAPSEEHTAVISEGVRAILPDRSTLERLRGRLEAAEPARGTLQR